MMMRRFLTSLATGAVLVPATALACAFHSYMPQETVIERMLGSDHIVLARAAPDDPFRFAPVAAIRGSAETADIPFLVDSATRRKLANDPDDVVLFAREGAYGPWQRLAYLDDEFREVIEIVATRLDAWEMGGDLERYRTFAPYHAHSDVALRQTALRELDWTPYEMLRELDIDVDTDAILAQIADPTEADLRPIRLLILGLSGDPRAEAYLRAGLSAAVARDLPPLYLGAYGTALVELAGAEGVATVIEIVADEAGDPFVRESLTEALAIQALANPEAARLIEGELGAAVAGDPALAGMVARQFGVRADWRFDDIFARLLEERRVRQPADLITLSQYVAFASQEAAARTVESQ